jgi:hypothetical protein
MQYRTYYLNEELDKNIVRLKKIEEVIKRQRHSGNESEHSINHTSRLALLLGDIKQMIMEVVLHNYKEEYIDKDNNNYYCEAMEKTHKIYEKIISKGEEKNIDEKLLTEAHMKFALFVDNILSAESKLVDDALKSRNIDRGELSVILVKSGFSALNRGASSSSSLIPRMLQALAKYPDYCGEAFTEGSKITPSWKFLGWKSQIIACINEPISDIIFTAVVNLFKNYPQALFYVFKVVESDLALKLVSVKESRLYRGLQKHCNTNHAKLNLFVESLDCLVDPEFRWKYWFDLIRESMLREDNIYRAKAASIAALMIENVAKEERSSLGRRIGLHNRHFARDFGQKIINAFGIDGKELLNMTYNQFVESIREVYSEVNNR